MQDVLPQNSGLSVNGVVYRYSVTKNTADSMLVHVRNRNVVGLGYVFSSTDDWSGLPGNSIQKAVPVNNIPLSYWGDGSIDVDGSGTVSDASVIYTYRVDECFNPQSSPTCDGYVSPVSPPPQDSIEVYNVLDDEAYNLSSEEASYSYDDEKSDEPQEDGDEEKDRKSRMERGLSASANALTIASAISQDAILSAMNYSTDISAYYSSSIDGGVYRDGPMLVDSKLPENQRGLRNGLAQQILHERMVEMQY